MTELKTYATHFCGIGGACWGLEQAGLKCNFAIDLLDYAVEFRRKNIGHQAACGDITTYTHGLNDAAQLLWTSFPCTTFSTSAREQVLAKAKFGIQDKRDELFLCSLEYVRQFKPDFFVCENVMGLMTRDADGVGQGSLTNIREVFMKAGYHVEWNVLCASNFGVPQKRERVFIIGAREDLGLSGLIPHEEEREKGEPPGVPFSAIAEYGTTLGEAWGDKTYRTAFKKASRTGVEMQIVFPADYLPTITCGWGGGATRKKVAIVDHGPDGTAFLRHPTLRECARAQGFPDGWAYPENKSKAWVLVGNAVASSVAKAIGEHLRKLSLGQRPPSKKKLSASRIAQYVKDYHDEIPP